MCLRVSAPHVRCEVNQRRTLVQANEEKIKEGTLQPDLIRLDLQFQLMYMIHLSLESKNKSVKSTLWILLFCLVQLIKVVFQLYYLIDVISVVLQLLKRYRLIIIFFLNFVYNLKDILLFELLSLSFVIQFFEKYNRTFLPYCIFFILVFFFNRQSKNC